MNFIFRVGSLWILNGNFSSSSADLSKSEKKFTNLRLYGSVVLHFVKMFCESFSQMGEGAVGGAEGCSSKKWLNIMGVLIIKLVNLNIVQSVKIVLMSVFCIAVSTMWLEHCSNFQCGHCRYTSYTNFNFNFETFPNSIPTKPLDFPLKTDPIAQVFRTTE